MNKPLVLFATFDEDGNYFGSKEFDENNPYDDGNWGVSVNGRKPKKEYFFSCKSKKQAELVRDALYNFEIAQSKLYNVMGKNISKYDMVGVDEEVYRMTEPH